MSNKLKVLVVVDMQKDFYTGALPNPQVGKIIPKVVELIKDEGYDFIFVTMDTHDSGYSKTTEGKHLPVEHCVIGTDGHGLISEIKDAVEGSVVSNVVDIKKEFFGSIQLANVIKSRNDEAKKQGYAGIEVDMCGTCTDICVISNAACIKAAADVEVNIIADACAGVSEESHETALKAMEAFQCNIIRG